MTPSFSITSRFPHATRVSIGSGAMIVPSKCDFVNENHSSEVSYEGFHEGLNCQQIDIGFILLSSSISMELKMEMKEEINLNVFIF